MNGKICQNCQQRLAEVQVIQVRGDQAIEFYVCSECAAQAGPGTLQTKAVSGEFLGVTPGEEAGRFEPTEETRTCPSCGQTYRGFRESGRLGCCECYDTFERELEPLLRKVQSGVIHTGKTSEGSPRPAAPVIDLQPIIQMKREQLRIAVSEEDFETAARLRDEIRNLEGAPSTSL